MRARAHGAQRDERLAPADGSGSATPALDEFGRDVTAEARAGRIDPVIGRDDEIEQTVEILARRRKNNAVLIGEAGVGKTAIAEGLALRIAEGDVPETLRDTRLVALDLAGMVAGSQFRGQFEQRLRPRSRRSSRPRAGSCCSSTSCTRSSAPATPRARWTPRTCSSPCSPAASCG